METGLRTPAKPNQAAQFAFQVETMALMGYDAAGIGERELGFGYDKLKEAAAKSKMPLISSNLIDKKSGKAAFKPYVVVKKGGLKVGIFSVIGPKIELPANTGEQLTIDDPIATAQKMVAELRKQADVVVRLAHLGRVEGEDLAAQVPGIDVVILAPPGLRRAGPARQLGDHGRQRRAGPERRDHAGDVLDGKKVLDLTSETQDPHARSRRARDLAKLTKEFEDAQNERCSKENRRSSCRTRRTQAPGGQDVG